MGKNRTIKRRVTAVPKSAEEAAEFVQKIGAAKRALETIDDRLGVKIERLKTAAETSAAEHQQRLEELFEGLFAYAQGHREELTDYGKRKTVTVPAGQYGWRLPPASVSLRDVPEVLKRLKALRLNQFIRVKEEPDKEAMLQHQEKAASVDGVTFKQEEEFFVKPQEVKTEVAGVVRKLTKAVGSEAAA